MLLLLLLLPGCAAEEDYFHRLHGPTDIAHLPPGEIFEVPLAYVPNFRSGQIAKLDLKRIDLLVEEGYSSWMAAPMLACGRDRVLDQVAVTSDGQTRIDVFVSDSQRGQVLRVPHVIPGTDGGHEFNPLTWGEPRLWGPDGSTLSDGPELADLQVVPGHATTEDWTIRYRDHSWEVSGTRSGPQLHEAVPGLPYETDGQELTFTVLHRGLAVEDGTAFTLSVDTGIVEFDLPGVVSDLRATPDGQMVIATVLGYGGDGGLWVYVDDDSTEWVDLPPGCVPENIGFHAVGDAFFVADSSDANRVLRVDYEPGEPASLQVTEIAVSEPAFDVAHAGDPEVDHLFVAAAFHESVEIVDLTTGEPVDVNPWTAAVDPIRVGSLITGLDASRGTLGMNTATPLEINEERYAVVATTYAGYMHIIEADTGCEVLESFFGPYLEGLDSGTEVVYYDVSPPSDTFMLADPVTGTEVSINPCGGIARDQLWTLRFRSDLQAWEVEGAESGIQEGLALEDVRYVSDDGEISFVLASGAQASTDGDWIQFAVNDGVSAVGVLELPSDPMLYTDIYDLREGSWWEHKERQVALVPNAGNDVVMWVHLEGYGDGGLKYFR
ncbi:MAG: hypothetical protein QGH45_01480 [Myxococcota bacterium]|nr:hypothetical protein [Myxococcota bacterium]